MRLITSPQFLQHPPGVYEKPDRLEELIDFYRQDSRVSRPINGYHYLTLAHSELYRDKVRKISRKMSRTHGIQYLDRQAETPIGAHTFGAGCYAVGAAIQAVQYTLHGENTIVAARPPGHHAHRDFGHGFCIFNPMAAAAYYATTRNEHERMLIVDLDLHHGDGTQAIVEQNPRIHYFSMHRGDLFPLTGTHSTMSATNIPYDHRITESAYTKLLSDQMTQLLELFSPTLIGISAGFDIFTTEDPALFGKQQLTPQVYATLLELIHPIPYVAVLEGGYSSQSVLDGVRTFMEFKP